jgi:BolA protein
MAASHELAPTPRTEAIERALKMELQATHVAIVDQSTRHQNHAGAEGGGGHFQVVVVSERFRGLSRLEAQRLVYAAVGDLMTTDIHALVMRTLTPEQWTEKAQGESG